MAVDVTHDVDLTSIEHLDFDPEFPCEHSSHDARHNDEPAKYLVEGSCPNCLGFVRYMICESGCIDLGRITVRCKGCRITGTRETFLSIVGTV